MGSSALWLVIIYRRPGEHLVISMLGQLRQAWRMGWGAVSLAVCNSWCMSLHLWIPIAQYFMHSMSHQLAVARHFGAGWSHSSLQYTHSLMWSQLGISHYCTTCFNMGGYTYVCLSIDIYTHNNMGYVLLVCISIENNIIITI